MRWVSWASVVLTSTLVWTSAAQERPDATPSLPNLPYVPCVNRDACAQIVHGYRSGGRAGREEARTAVDRVRELCADGEGIACSDLAFWTAEGVDEIVRADLGAARGFARRSCDLGFNCEILEALSHPPPTPAEEDDIREAVFRRYIPRERPQGAGRSPIYCLAFGTDANPTGQDPPPGFMARFADLEDVKPRSWCVEHRTGNRFAVGPVDPRPRPHPMERIVHVWSLHQYFGGGGGVAEVRVTQKAGTWVADRELSPSMTLPPFPQRDLADERRRIAGTVSAFAQAWNGRDFEAMARLNVEDRKNYRGNLWTRHVRAIEDLGTDTRIDESIEAIEFEKPGSMSATVRLRLHGTWRPSPGAIVPLEPWKHEGAVTTVRLQLQKQTSSWEPGDWTILFLHPPWGDRALHY